MLEENKNTSLLTFRARKFARSVSDGHTLTGARAYSGLNICLASVDISSSIDETSSFKRNALHVPSHIFELPVLMSKLSIEVGK